MRNWLRIRITFAAGSGFASLLQLAPECITFAAGSGFATLLQLAPDSQHFCSWLRIRINFAAGSGFETLLQLALCHFCFKQIESTGPL